ncbi:hypothetical protein [Streptomyces luteireticuli]|uniref:Uncharacterized protein n=1 Tax=Streptomyces luteireticuli TaxID=173858 RepID=A0ABN0YRD4_9ACTN
MAETTGPEQAPTAVTRDAHWWKPWSWDPRIRWRLLIWLFGGVAAELLPVWIRLLSTGKESHIEEILRGADVPMAAAVLCAASLVERVGRGVEKYDSLALLSIILGVGGVFVNAVYAHQVINSPASGAQGEAVPAFIFALAAAIGCVATGVE